MRNTFIILFMLASICLTGCKDKDCIGGINMAVELGVKYKDSLNRDLLDPSKIYAYKYANMYHYTLDTANHRTMVNTGGDYPKDIVITQDADSTYRLGLFPDGVNYANQTGIVYSTDILELSSTDEDTIQSEIEITKINCGQNIVTKRIWYNGVLVYTYGVQPDRRITIYK